MPCLASRGSIVALVAATAASCAADRPPTPAAAGGSGATSHATAADLPREHPRRRGAHPGRRRPAARLGREGLPDGVEQASRRCAPDVGPAARGPAHEEPLLRRRRRPHGQRRRRRDRQVRRRRLLAENVPAASRALWSPDGATWSSYSLEGEAYDEPGISPDGQNAVWPQHGRYVTRSAAGFDEHTVDSEGQEYPVTATITDAAQVSFLYFVSLPRRLPPRGPDPHRRRDAGAAGPRDRSGCGFVRPRQRRQRHGLVRRHGLARRSAPSSPAPTRPRRGRSRRSLRSTPQGSSRPGESSTGGSSPPPDCPCSPSAPPTAASCWPRPTTRSRSPGARPSRCTTPAGWCQWGDTWTSESIEVLVAELRCGQGRRVALTTGDGTSWRAVQGSRVPRGISADGRYVVVPARSPHPRHLARAGRRVAPGRVSGRCDVAVPDGPDGAVLLTSAGRNQGWPTVLQHSTPEGWSRLSRTSLPTPRRVCRSRQASWQMLDSLRHRLARPGLHGADRRARRPVDGAPRPLVTRTTRRPRP